MRLVNTTVLGDCSAKIYKNEDEYIVKFYKNGVCLGDECAYYTNDLQDAVGTANAELSFIKVNHAYTK